MADQWFNPALATHAVRWQLQLPDFQAVRAYLLDTLESTLELLDKTAEDDEGLYFFRVALFHEDIRCEQLVSMAQTLAVPIKLALPVGVQSRDPVLVPAGRWLLGSSPGGFVFDAEKWAHEIDVPEFEIDAQPVNWGQYVEFVDDGGYDRPEFWLPQGWEWLQREAHGEGRRGPRYVDQIGSASGAVMQMLFGKSTRMAASQSAMHLSWWEADAWARWAGRRLPTEVEWEMAAHTARRRGFRWGDVREWTASTLRPWPGFEPDGWSRHTELEAQPQFGLARVQRGGSFAARSRMKHPSSAASRCRSAMIALSVFAPVRFRKSLEREPGRASSREPNGIRSSGEPNMPQGLLRLVRNNAQPRSMHFPSSHEKSPLIPASTREP